MIKRVVSAFLAMLLICSAAGCARKPDGAVTPGPDASPSVPAVTDAPLPTDGPEPTPEPGPTLEPEAAEALSIAARHGLTAEDLRGEYGLFTDFAEVIEGNAALGKYGEFVFRIFPVIADHTEYLDREYFLGRLAGLSFDECELEAGVAGRFEFEPNAIMIDREHIDRVGGNCEFPDVVFHELMHFVDLSMSGEESAQYLLDGERLTSAEFLALPLEDQIRTVIVYGADAVREGGAELYTAKYFAGAVRWYFNAVNFLTGLEYIFGTEAMDELFFGRDSDAAFAELFVGAGYTEDEYYTACSTLNWFTDPIYNTRPADSMRPEDILIDLYEHKLGEGWRADERFLYILKSINGVAWSGYEESEHAEFLSGIEFNMREQYEAFLDELYAGLPFRLSLNSEPPVPVIRNGRFMLTAFAEWTDPDTGETVRGTIAAEFDPDGERPAFYELTDMEAVFAEYFG